MRVHGIGLITCFLALLALSACSFGGYKPALHDGAEFVAMMAAARDALLDGHESEFSQLYLPSARETAIPGDWTALQRDRQHFGDRRFRTILTPPDLGTQTFTADLAQFTLTAWYDFKGHFAHEEQCYQTAWRFIRDEETGDWHLAGISIDHPSREYDYLHHDLVRLSRGRMLMLGMDWETDLDPAPLWQKTYQALQAGDEETLLRCSVSGTVQAATDQNIQFATVALEDNDGNYNRWATKRWITNQIMELQRFHREMNTSEEQLAPLFNFYPILSMPDDCKMVRMNVGYSGRGLRFGMYRITVSWTGFRPHDRWLTEGMWVECAEIATL